MNDKSSLLFDHPIFPHAYLASPVVRESGLATIEPPPNLPQVPNLWEVRQFLAQTINQPMEFVFDMGREEVGYLLLSLSGAGCAINCFYGESW